MDKQLTKRLIENEAVFRKYNERVESAFDELRQIASEEESSEVGDTGAMTFEFFCECSDENCKKRVPLSLDRYSKIHANRNKFTIVPGHQVAAVEKVVRKTKRYYEVEKYISQPISPDRLHKTPVENV